MNSLYAAAAAEMQSLIGLSFAATAFGLGWLVLILGALLWEGLERAVAEGLHRNDAATGLRRRAC